MRSKCSILIQWVCRSASVQRPYVTEVTCRGELIAVFVEAPRADYYGDDDEEKGCIYLFQLGTQAPFHVLPDPDAYYGFTGEDYMRNKWAPDCRLLGVYWTILNGDHMHLTCLGKGDLSERLVGPIWTHCILT